MVAAKKTPLVVLTSFIYRCSYYYGGITLMPKTPIPVLGYIANFFGRACSLFFALQLTQWAICRQWLSDGLSVLRQKCYLCFMPTFNVEILNPKAKKLLMDLADLRLISISESISNPFLDTVKKIRSKKAKLTINEITNEVENVRSKRNAK